MDDIQRVTDELRERLSKLSEASLRITEDLDLDSVLQGVVDSARTLTGARISAITVLDEASQLLDFITSGMTAEDHRRFVELPGGPEFFSYLSAIPQPLRLTDFSAHTTALGLPEIRPPLGPVRTFLGAPIRHRGQHLGNLYLSDKQDGPEFTQEDEETLQMFASQAAMAISNARRLRDERRARADLETLVNTAPVGVVVLDASTGRFLSFNREATRLVDDLRDPDQSPEELLETLTFRRSGGQEFALPEVPLTRVLGMAETVRAEEVVIRVPDGRSVTVLVNATPIRSEDGEVESVVVTLQDMTAVKEDENMRSEFLGVVGQKLLTPLAAIKGAATSALESAFPAVGAEARQFFHIINEQANGMRNLLRNLIDMTQIESGKLVVTPEPVEVPALIEMARTAFLREHADISVEAVLPPMLPRVMADWQRILQVLDTLLSIAAQRSAAHSTIRIGAMQNDVHVAVTVATEREDRANYPIESQIHEIYGEDYMDEDSDEMSERLGLTVSRGIVEAHGGRIRFESDEVGQGVTCTLTLPTVAESVLEWTALRGHSSSLWPIPENTHVLTLDADQRILWYVRSTLSQNGHITSVSTELEDLSNLIDTIKPEVILLDLEMARHDLTGVMARLAGSSYASVVLLVRQSDDNSISQAISLGADDYIIKPFSATELMARISTVLRRRNQQLRKITVEPYILNELIIDYSEQSVTFAGEPLHLTQTEKRLLFELSVNAGEVLSTQQLMRRIWSHRELWTYQIVRSYVKRLRTKLGDDAKDPTYIFSRRGLGYYMVRPENRNAEVD